MYIKNDLLFTGETYGVSKFLSSSNGMVSFVWTEQVWNQSIPTLKQALETYLVYLTLRWQEGIVKGQEPVLPDCLLEKARERSRTSGC